VAFAWLSLNGALVVATDGLWSYAQPADICRIVRGGDHLEAAVQQFAELVSLPIGELMDDVALVQARRLGW